MPGSTVIDMRSSCVILTGLQAYCLFVCSLHTRQRKFYVIYTTLKSLDYNLIVKKIIIIIFRLSLRSISKTLIMNGKLRPKNDITNL